MTRQRIQSFRRQVRDAKWTSWERTYRATALELADLSDGDGTFSIRREKLAQRLCLSPRALDYHLAWLIDHRWLELKQRPVTRAKVTRPATYRLRLPDEFHSQSSANEDAVSFAICNERKPPVSFATACETHIKSPNASEGVAVDEHAADDRTAAALATALALMAGRGSARHPQGSDIRTRAAA